MSGAAIAARQLPSPAMSGRRPLQADGSQAPRASPTSRRHPATSARAPPACAPLSQLSAPAKKQYRYSRGPSSRASATRGLAPLSLSGRAASAMGATAGTAGTTTHTNMLALEEAANVLDGIELIILDCDGVLWRGSESIGLVPESLAVFREQGKRLLFVTNNASKSRAQVKEKLATYRIEANAEEVVTSGYAAAQYLLSIGFDRKAFVVGDQGLEAELIEAGVEFVGGTSFEATHRFDVAEFSSMEVDPAVGAVVVGFDGLFSYQKLAYAATCLREIPGCRLVCTNLDHGDNIGGGRIMPGTGCLVACVETGAGRPAFNVGKGGTWLLPFLVEKYGVRPEASCIVGDRLDTDIATGLAGGMKTFLPLTGVTTEEQVLAAGPEEAPMFYMPSIARLAGLA